MSVAAIGQLHTRYIRLSDKFKAAWTYNQFAAGVYKTFLDAPLPYQIDFQKAYEKIKKASDQIQSVIANSAGALLDECDSELQRTIARLIEADTPVTPTVLRRFFEKLKRQDEKIIFFLVKFYLYAESITPDQKDKIDFLLTKIGEEFVEERGEYWSKDSLELRKQFQGVVSVREFAFAPQEEIIILIRTIRGMRDEIQNAPTIEQITEKRLLEKLRSLKHGMGDQFFHPDVLLAIVDANVVTKNRFLKLYHAEEERILEDSRKLVDSEELLARTLAGSNPNLVEEIARFRQFKEEFDDSRAQSNLKHGSITHLKQSMNGILAQLDRGLDHDSSKPVQQEADDFFLKSQRLDVVQAKFGRDQLLHNHLQRIVSVLDSYDVNMTGSRITGSTAAKSLRLESWEVSAYQKLYLSRRASEEETEDLLLLYLRSAALRMKIDEEAKIMTAFPSNQVIDPDLLERAGASLERAKEYDHTFEDFIHEGIYFANPKNLHRLNRSRFRLLRAFSGLWLLFDQHTER